MQDFIGTVIEKAFELVDVVVENGQQTASAVALKKIHLQLLEMVVGLKTKAVLCGLGQIAPQHPVEIFEQGFSCPDDEGQACQHGELGWHGGGPQLGEPGRVLLNDHIHRKANQHRGGKVEDLVDH